MQEIFPTSGPAGLISPAVLGALSRRLPSELAVQNLCPSRKGLVGVSSGPSLRRFATLGSLRKTSATLPPRVTTTIALRSFGSAQILPAASRAMPSTPSRYGCATRILFRHRVLGVNVVSQFMGLRTLPSRFISTF